MLDVKLPRVKPPNALQISVTGIVQGVGFRPFVHRLAQRHQLDGWVRNTSGTVEIRVEGTERALGDFRRDLEGETPPLCRIGSVVVVTVESDDITGFRIKASAPRPQERQAVSPDMSSCSSCLEEMYHPGNRRYRYPFITCTDCGPRITVIDDIPYDRERTSMRMFEQCPACLREYHDADSRRFHCQTNSCPICGPNLTWVDPSGRRLRGNRLALEAAATALRQGAVVALRGLGGFHLAVDATNEDAVELLRRRKRREAKPLAVMVRTTEEAHALARLTDAEVASLESPERPIVLVNMVPRGPLAGAIAPGLTCAGVMLAYTPLHHLLLDLVDRPLVMTSGNLSEEPIAASNDEALERLRHIADGFLLHDRDIVNRYDDSVLAVAPSGGAIMLRRARGYAPRPVSLPLATPEPLVAVGPQLKSTFTLAHDGEAFISQHLGDLENMSTLEHFQASLARYQRLFRIRPTVAVRDLHPGYLSTRIAEDLGLERVMTVQHHHAHIAAVMGEHGLVEPVLGVAYDGTGYGDDGTVWGAEIMVADLTGYQRVAHLRPAPLPGGDAAVRAPWRVALGYRSLDPGAVGDAFALSLSAARELEREIVEQQLARHLNSPMASSMGRLFDAAASVLGIRQQTRYEGQAAMELEARAGWRAAELLPYDIAPVDGCWVLDPLPILVALGERRAAGGDPGDLAAAFHDTVIAATAELLNRAREASGLRRVVICGGSFQNVRLHVGLRRRLAAEGYTVLAPIELSPNDGAVSYGQAVVAAAQLQADSNNTESRRE